MAQAGSSELETTAKPQVIHRCKKFRRIVSSEEKVVSHERGKRDLSFKWNKRSGDPWETEKQQINCTMDDALNGNTSPVDVATKKNLNDLVTIDEQLLKKPVSRVNLDTGFYEPANHETNEEALKRFAGLLSNERKFRKSQTPNGNAEEAK